MITDWINYKSWTWTGIAGVLSHLGLWATIGLNTFNGCTPTPPVPTPSATIALPATLQGDAGRLVQITADTKGTSVAWWCEDSADISYAKATSTKAVFTGKEGTYKVVAATNIGGQTYISNTCLVTIGKSPDPGPGPTPPDPPTPLPTDGFRVLIVRPANGQGLSASQVTMLSSPTVRNYLTGKCIKVGNQAEYRIFDSSQDLAKESKVWQDAMAKARNDMQKQPTAKAWLLAINTKTGISMPLPDNEADLMKALTPIGG